MVTVWLLTNPAGIPNIWGTPTPIQLRICQDLSDAAISYGPCARRGHAVALVVITCCAAGSACGEVQPRHRASHFLRALQRRAIRPEMITYCATGSARRTGQQCQQALHPLRVGRRHRAGCDHVPCSHRCVRKRGPAATPGLTSLTSGAALCHSAGRDHVLAAASRIDNLWQVLRLSRAL